MRRICVCWEYIEFDIKLILNVSHKRYCTRLLEKSFNYQLVSRGHFLNILLLLILILHLDVLCIFRYITFFFAWFPLLYVYLRVCLLTSLYGKARINGHISSLNLGFANFCDYLFKFSCILNFKVFYFTRESVSKTHQTLF